MFKCILSDWERRKLDKEFMVQPHFLIIVVGGNILLHCRDVVTASDCIM